MCLTRGASVGRAILPKRKMSTDQDAIHVADSLRAMGQIDEADVVESCRGMHWIRVAKEQANNSTSADFHLSNLFLGIGDSTECQIISTMVTRAARFFIRSKDRSRLCAVFDSALRALIAAHTVAAAAADRYHDAVSGASGAVNLDSFSSLHGLVLPAEGMSCLFESSGSLRSGIDLINAHITGKHLPVDARDYVPKFVSAEADERLKEAVLSVIVLNQTISNAKLLLDTIGNYELLCSISMTPSFEHGFSNEIISGSLGITLVRYIEALELIQRSFSLLRDGDPSNNRGLAVCALKKSCQLLVTLISRNPGLGDSQG